MSKLYVCCVLDVAVTLCKMLILRRAFCSLEGEPRLSGTRLTAYCA